MQHRLVIFLCVYVVLAAATLHAAEQLKAFQKLSVISEEFANRTRSGVDPKERDAFVKESTANVVKLAEEALDGTALEDRQRRAVFYLTFNGISKLFTLCEPAEQTQLLKEFSELLDKHKTDERDAESLLYYEEAVLLLPIYSKLMNAPESLPIPEMLTLLDSLRKTLEPMKLDADNQAAQMVVELSRNGVYMIDHNLKDPAMRPITIPVMETFSKLLLSKENRRVRYFGWVFAQMRERVASQGKDSPWSSMEFTDQNGTKMKIADLKGKSVLVAFQPTNGPMLGLLKDCFREWKDKGLQIVLVTSLMEGQPKKCAEYCGVDFPFWNVVASGINVDIDKPQPPQWSAWFPSAMLIGADGKVVDPYLGRKEIVPQLAKLLGEPKTDVADRFWNFLFKELRVKKLLDYPADATETQLFERLQDALTAMLTPPQNMFDQQYVDSVGDLLELADRVAAKTTNRKRIELMYGGLLFLTQKENRISGKLPDFTMKLADAAKKHDLPKIAADARLLDFQTRIDQTRSKPGEFLKLRDEIFTFLLDNEGKWSPTAAVSLLRKLGYASYVLTDAEQLKTYVAISKILGATNDPEIRDDLAQFVGVVTRLRLVGNEMPLEGETLNGKPYDPAAFKGKIVLVDFWATWCGPCLAEIPNMTAMYEKYHDKEFDIVSISTDKDLKALEQHLAKKPLPWICLADTKLKDAGKQPMQSRYGVTAIPTMILVGRDGKVIMLEARGDALVKKLSELLD